MDLYRQLTGVTFARHNPNCPHELKGFVACAGPTTNLKTFTFNTAEHSSSLMGGYIWNVLEDMHTKNWEYLSKWYRLIIASMLIYYNCGLLKPLPYGISLDGP